MPLVPIHPTEWSTSNGLGRGELGTPATEPGFVYLVGAGPGNSGLITRRGAECLGRADVVLIDYLVNPALLEHAPPEAERVSLGHHGKGRELTPEEIATRMIDAARRGRTVVRLKGGDPSVFARGGDEVGALRAAEIPFEIVPGVTSGLVAASYTDMIESAGAVALVTGRQRPDKGPEGLDYAQLAAFPGALVFYMGICTAPDWAEALMAHGRPPETPAAIVRRCTWPDEQIARCALAEVANVIRRQRLRPPAIVVVGAPSVRPLTEPPADVLGRLEQFDWLVIGSPGDATRLLAQLSHRGIDARRLADIRLIAVGEDTARWLSDCRIRADLTVERRPGEAVAEPLVRACRSRRVLLAHTGDDAGCVAESLAAVASQLESTA